MKRLLSFLLLLPLFASAQTPVSNNFQINAPKAIDSRTHKLTSTPPITSIPYANTSEANTAIPLDRRYEGLTICIGTPTSCTEYWYHGGTANVNLTMKLVPSDWNFVVNKPTYFPTSAADIAAGSATSGQVLGFNGTNWGPLTISSGGGGSDAADLVPLVAMNGESNSGGQADNADLNPSDTLFRPRLQILNNDSFKFQPLKIGGPFGNQMIGHNGPFGPIPNTKHGWENGLAFTSEAGLWKDTVYTAKTGQGGCTIAQLSSDLYFMPFVNRIKAAQAELKAKGKTPVVFIWYTQGINDAIAGTNIITWKAATKAHLLRLRSYVGFAPIIIPYFMTGYAVYDAAFDEIAQELPMIYRVSSTGAGLEDALHWDAQGMKLIAQRMASVCVDTIGLKHAYILAQTRALSNYTATSSGGGSDTGAISFRPAVYNTISKATDDGDGVLTYNGSVATTNGGPGGTSTLDVNTTVDFKVLYTVQPNPDAVVIALDSKPTADYSSSSVWKACMYFFSGSLYVGTNTTNPAASTNLGSGFNFVRWEKSGNDVLLKTSIDGSTFTTAYTHTGILSGTTSLKLRVQYAVASGAAKLSYTDPTLAGEKYALQAPMVRSVSSTYTVVDEDYTIKCTSGTFTVNLPPAATFSKRIFIIKNMGAGTITVDPNGSETIDGTSTVALSTIYSTIQLQSDGINWINLTP